MKIQETTARLKAFSNVVDAIDNLIRDAKNSIEYNTEKLKQEDLDDWYKTTCEKDLEISKLIIPIYEKIAENIGKGL